MSRAARIDLAAFSRSPICRAPAPEKQRPALACDGSHLLVEGVALVQRGQCLDVPVLIQENLSEIIEKIVYLAKVATITQYRQRFAEQFLRSQQVALLAQRPRQVTRRDRRPAFVAIISISCLACLNLSSAVA